MNWIKGEYHPKQQRADRKKNRILDAALESFGENGFHGSTAKAIAARAGVATGSFYRYFRDKKAAFMAVCMRMETEFGEHVFEYGEKMRREGRSEKDILDALTRHAVSAHHRHKAFHREVLAMQFSDPDVAAWVQAREKRLIEELTSFLTVKRASYRVVDLEAVAELIYYTIEEVAHRSVLFDSPVGEKRLVHTLQEMFASYLFKP